MILLDKSSQTTISIFGTRRSLSWQKQGTVGGIIELKYSCGWGSSGETLYGRKIFEVLIHFILYAAIASKNPSLQLWSSVSNPPSSMSEIQIKSVEFVHQTPERPSRCEQVQGVRRQQTQPGNGQLRSSPWGWGQKQSGQSAWWGHPGSWIAELPLLSNNK